MSKIELKENLKKYSNLDECPIRNIISRFSGKWPVIILCILSENECTRFNQIQKAIPDISPKVLSDTLKNLETDGIIKRIVYGEVPPRVEYSLTKLGLSLMQQRLFEETDKDPLFGDESGENLSYESLPADHPVTNYRARQVASCLRNNSPLSTPIKRISHQPK